MDPEIAASQTFSSESKVEAPSFSYGKNAPPGYKSDDERALNPNPSAMFKSVEYARNTTRGTFLLLKKLGTFFFCSITITVILLVLMAIPITMIVVGVVNFKKCPMQKMIPIWLIVFGALSIIKNISTLFQRLKNLRNREESGQSSNILLNVFDSFMALFLIIWFVCGNIWTYSKWGIYQYTDPLTPASYCDRFTFLFTFWIITSIYIVILMACILFCCTICFTIFIPAKK